MNPTSTSRPLWPIDQVLERLVGAPIRLAAESFIPIRWDGEPMEKRIGTRELILPDQTQPGPLPVYFEGRLREFTRQIGVVDAWLDAVPLIAEPVEGTIRFRGSTAVILPGPAIVRLAFPFKVERLPADSANYWEDLRLPRAQFWLRLD